MSLGVNDLIHSGSLSPRYITAKGNGYVLVLMDHFTKFVNVYVMPAQRATTVARCIFEIYERQHGVPVTLHTDQGKQFDSDLMHTLCQKLVIEKSRTTPYHPQADGLIERFNRTLKEQLGRCMAYRIESGTISIPM